MSQRALIIGGSLGGLFAAHLLRSIGWETAVYERNSEDLQSRGVGIGTHPQLIDVIRRLGLQFDESMGVRVGSVICLDRNGGLVLEQKTVRTMSAWGRIYRCLRDALPSDTCHYGMSLSRVEQDASSVTAHFTDGTSARGDLLIGADEIRSTVREQLLPQAQPQYAGYVAWRAMLDEAEIPADIHAAVFERYTFCLPDGEQLLAYPVPGKNNSTRRGERAYNIVWYRPVEAATLADYCTDASGKAHGMAIPPPLIRPDVVARVRQDARDLIAPAIAEIFVRSPQPFFQAIFDLKSSQIAFGRAALLGDAAFVARPHVGAGATKAALDALALAEALQDAAGNLDVGLARYDEKQRRFGRELVALGREQGAYLSAQLKPFAERSELERERDIHSVLHRHGTRSEEVRRLVAARDAAAAAM